MSGGRWSGWLLNHWDALRSGYWFFPAQMAFLSGVAALGMVEIDRRKPPDWGSALPWLTEVSAESARAVLSTIAGSMITVTGVVFSITVVALTLTSSQFGPRLLRTFFRDRASQLALGTFLATFCYSLLVLRAVTTPDDVPHLATVGAVLLAITSLFVLIFFVHHAASSLQASSVIAAVGYEIDEQLPTLFPENLGEGQDHTPSPADRERVERLDRDGRVLPASDEGYVRVVEAEAILDLAVEHDLTIRLEANPGDFVTRGSPLARVLPGDALDADRAEELLSSWIIGDHRTPVQDVRFLTGQLAEMAIRALSPGVNDPKTALGCVQRLGSVVTQLAARDLPSGLRYDREGILRVVARPADFGAIAGDCFDGVRRYGGHEPDVAGALLEGIAMAAPACRSAERLRVLEEHAEEAYVAFTDSTRHTSKRDRAQVDRAFERTRAVLAAAAASLGAAEGA